MKSELPLTIGLITLNFTVIKCKKKSEVSLFSEFDNRIIK